MISTQSKPPFTGVFIISVAVFTMKAFLPLSPQVMPHESPERLQESNALPMCGFKEP